MRKTSQDGGDNTSITSGLENDIKKPIVGIMKTKRNSIKKKVQNFSHDSDDAVIEPLLHKEKTETPNQSAKSLLPKIKTESSCEKGNDRDKLLSDDRVEKPSLSTAPSVYGNAPGSNLTKEINNHLTKSYENSTTIHNHMNTNVFSSFDDAKKIVTPKSQILVEIDSNKPTGYNPSPLIFTTAKIHTDIKTKSMEPVQVTPVPILSIIEGSVKVGIDKKLSGLCDKGNNMGNNIYIKPNEIQTKDVNIENTRTTVSSFSPCILSNENTLKTNVGLNQNTAAASSSTLSNDSIKPVVNIDIKTIPNNPGKSDFNTATKNLPDSKKESLNIGTTDSFKANASIVDVNKNIEANKIAETSSDRDLDSKKQLPIQKCSDELNSISDKNTNSTIVKNSAGKSIIDLKIEKNPPETTLTKSKNDNSNSLSKSSPVSSTSLTLGGKMETSSTKILTTASNSIVKSPCTTTTPISNTFIKSAIVSVDTSAMTVPTKNKVSNVISTVKPTVSEETSLKKASATSTPSPLIKSSSLVKSTATAKTPTSKPSSVKTIPMTTSSFQSAKTIPSQSTSVSAVTMPVSGANTILNKAVKPTESLSSNMKTNIKTVSANIDSQKSLNRPQTTASTTSNSSVSSSIISNVKKQESTNQTPKSATSGSKSTTSTIISKTATVPTTQTSFSGKQISTKPTSTKSSNSSVKTLITSSDKPSSSGSVKTTTFSKPQNKPIESKGTESNKRV